MRFARAASIFILVLFCVSCDRPAIDPSKSLVGAKKLPPARVLSRETIYIARGYGALTPGRLAYELHPDNKLEVTFTGKNLSTVIDRETFNLDANLAAALRRSLWPVRPEQLQGVQWDTMPTGCQNIPTDTFPEVTVAFVAEGPEPGVEDDRVGVFSLPPEIYCRTRQATEARKLIEHVLHSLPASKVAAEFDRQTPRSVIVYSTTAAPLAPLTGSR